MSQRLSSLPHLLTRSFSVSSSSSPFSRSTSPLIDRILRVDHAGEFGAQWIYEGQRAGIQARKALKQGQTEKEKENEKLITNMQETEKEHLRAIEELMPVRAVRPSLLLPMWQMAGFGVGMLSSLMGDRAAMACTVAVEEVITEHYNDQLRELSVDPDMAEQEKLLRKLIKKHRDEEDEHREIGIQQEAEQAIGYKTITQAIKMGVRGAIWITQKI